MRTGSTELEDLLGAWFVAWTALRSYRTAFATGHNAALRLDRSGDWEYFVYDPEPAAFATVAAEVAQSQSRALCVVGPDINGYVAQAHAAGLGMLSISEQIMVLNMETQDKQGPFLSDPDLVLDVHPLGGRRVASRCQARFSATITAGKTVLASGKAAIFGDFVVFDQIETHPEHRRRGYGRALMQALIARAMEFPVTTGLLLASTDGQRLYYKLGWRSVSPVTVLMSKARLASLAASR